jgi:ribosomal protein L37AE/L43A
LAAFENEEVSSWQQVSKLGSSSGSYLDAAKKPPLTGANSVLVTCKPWRPRIVLDHAPQAHKNRVSVFNRLAFDHRRVSSTVPKTSVFQRLNFALNRPQQKKLQASSSQVGKEQSRLNPPGRVQISNLSQSGDNPALNEVSAMQSTRQWRRQTSHSRDAQSQQSLRTHCLSPNHSRALCRGLFRCRTCKQAGHAESYLPQQQACAWLHLNDTAHRLFRGQTRPDRLGF